MNTEPFTLRPVTDREWVERLKIEGDHPIVAQVQRLRSIALNLYAQLDEMTLGTSEPNNQ